jgi:hypothetical protein
VTSTFAWLDFDEPARQRMREIVGLLRESGSIDELGLGRMRDSFSERLFPGTSVLWRRARYLLFVAWTYQQLEREGYTRQTCEAAARAIQRKLRDAILVLGDKDHTGLIGLRTADPVSPPDVILWAALEHWGVRERGAGTLSQYRATIPRRPRKLDDEAMSPPSVWNPRMPGAPGGFPEACSFALRREEATFLRDLILADDADRSSTPGRRADSLLADLLRVGELHAVPVPWKHVLSDAASPELREALHLGGCFSDVMHGATTLYARRLAELRKDEDSVHAADEALAGWTERISAERPRELEAWATDLDRFFAVVNEQRRTSATERNFVRRFSALALADPRNIASSTEARILVEEREAQSKGGKARLTAPRDKDRGDGGAIPAPLTYRWGNALSLAQDIRTGLAV